MSEPTSSELSSIARKLDELHEAISDAVKRAQKRNESFVRLTVCICIFLVGYLGYAYHRFGGEVTPALVASNAQASFETYIPQASRELEDQLKSNAPRFVNGTFDEVKTLPSQLSDELNKQSAEKIDSAMPAVEDQLSHALEASLGTSEKNQTGSDKERFQGTLTALGNVYGTDTIKFVNDAHRTYASQAVEFINYLDRLASDQKLDRRDQLHRDMFLTIFTLVREHDKRSGTTDPLQTHIL